MAGETVITVVGNLTNDPELRYTTSGSAVVNFSIASTPRIFDRKNNDWVDGETLFLRCSVWRDMAENVAESLQKGMRVIVTGRLRSRSYDTREGERRTVFELEVEEIGPSLRYSTCAVTSSFRGNRANQNNSGGGSYGNSNFSSNQKNSGDSQPRNSDPWNMKPADENTDWGSGIDSEDPPF